MVQADAHAFWMRAPGVGEIRPVTLPAPEEGDVMVRTLRSGVSRGTETLVFRGGVPPDQYAVMRAPFQEGDFPAPVKYGYLNVGAVEEGPAELQGRMVFCLYPHQTAYVVPAGAVTVVPDGVPPDRAVLAGTVETAVNALWDAAPLVGDRIAVVGAGMVGCCVARLLSRFPAVQVTLVDVDRPRAEVAAALGVEFALPADAAGGCDLVAARERYVRGAPALPRAARARGDRDRTQLVRRPRGTAGARGRISLGASGRPRQPGGHRLPGAQRGAARRPTGSRWHSSCCATPRLTRSSPAGRALTSCPT